MSAEDQPIRVLFVCLGNICRSPMAQGLFAHLAEQRGLAHRFEVDSAGTAAYHQGEPPDARTVAVLRGRGVALDHRARQVQADDFEAFDWVIAMDAANLRALRGRCPEPLRGRLHLARDPIGGGDVDDPYYGGAEGFERNFEELTRALDAWIDRMLGG
jgi:protein-tyrosine-phosphatase